VEDCGGKSGGNILSFSVSTAYGGENTHNQKLTLAWDKYRLLVPPPRCGVYSSGKYSDL
jgi:hypothetical protein